MQAGSTGRKNYGQMRILAFIATLILTLGLGLSACGPGDGTNGNGDLEIKLAPIHELDVRFAESFPVQVFLYVKGGLSDGCTKFHGLEIKSRSGNIINIEVTVDRPRDAVCPAIYGYFEQNVNLGTDFKSGETYTVTVNNESTSFVMP